MPTPADPPPTNVTRKLTLHAGHEREMTSATSTTYTIVNPTPREGGTVEILIQTRNDKGIVRETGGDLLMTRMYWATAPRTSCAGKVVDLKNGTYRVSFYAVRKGIAQIHLYLVYPAKTAAFIRNTYWNTEHRLFWTGIYKSHSALRKRPVNYSNRTCTIERSVKWKRTTDTCEYSREKVLGQTRFVCERNFNSQCDADKDVLNSMKLDIERSDNRTLQIIKGNEQLFQR